MNAVYTRVSTEEQERKGYSLVSQAEACRNRLMSISNDEIKLYEDGGYSGEFLDRPKLTELREDMRAGLIQNLCIYDPDRLSRNLTNQLLIADEIETAKVNLYFITGDYDASPEGKLFFQMRGAISAFEKAKIRERTMRGKRAKALSNKIVNRRPFFGYDWDEINSTYTVNEKEAKIVKSIYNMCIDKKMGLLRIANFLVENKILNKQGRPFNIKAVWKILIRSIYTGTYYEFRESWEKTGQRTHIITANDPSKWIAVTVPAIVTEEQQLEAKRQLASNLGDSRRNSQYVYLLSGIIKCGFCGRGMVAVPAQKGRLRYYYCHGKDLKKCPESGYVRTDEIEKEVWDYVTKIIKEKRIPKNENIINNDNENEINELSKKEKELIKAQLNITSLVAENLIEFEMAKKQLHQLNKDIAKVKNEISELKAIKTSINNSNIFKITTEDITNATTKQKKKELLKDSGISVIVTKYKRKKMNIKVKI